MKIVNTEPLTEEQVKKIRSPLANNKGFHIPIEDWEKVELSLQKMHEEYGDAFRAVAEKLNKAQE
ncbi:MAG: hypothetical protein HQL66_07210 [Magnetococcales bacterium]|nr:hypothetical protein [Magnetococcales bacterium]